MEMNELQEGRLPYDYGVTQNLIGIEAQKSAKDFALVIKSSLFEGIFVYTKGVN